FPTRRSSDLVVAYRNDKLVADACRSHYYIEMSVRYRVKTPRVHECHKPSLPSLYIVIIVSPYVLLSTALNLSQASGTSSEAPCSAIIIPSSIIISLFVNSFNASCTKFLRYGGSIIIMSNLRRSLHIFRMASE